MATQIDTAQREVVLIEEAHIRRMMGLDGLEPLPSARIPYPMVDPYLLVHEAVVPITPERPSLDTRHPHRGFDNLWYAISGSSRTPARMRRTGRTAPSGRSSRSTWSRPAAPTSSSSGSRSVSERIWPGQIWCQNPHQESSP